MCLIIVSPAIHLPGETSAHNGSTWLDHVVAGVYTWVALKDRTWLCKTEQHRLLKGTSTTYWLEFGIQLGLYILIR